MHLSKLSLYQGGLDELPSGKILINTINAHSYNIAQKDHVFKKSLVASDVLLPDGVSIVWAMRWLVGQRLKKTAGANLFEYEMSRLNKTAGTCFFLGSNDVVLQKIRYRAANEFSDVKVFTYSPPYKPVFSSQENQRMLALINEVKPDVLFIGMTAPKQEKWAMENYYRIEAKHICSIGAVFDFYAGTITRAPHWMIVLGLEWLYRFAFEPRRLWKRYLIGNFKFISSIVREKIMLWFQKIKREPVV